MNDAAESLDTHMQTAKLWLENLAKESAAEWCWGAAEGVFLGAGVIDSALNPPGSSSWKDFDVDISGKSLSFPFPGSSIKKVDVRLTFFMSYIKNDVVTTENTKIF